MSGQAQRRHAASVLATGVRALFHRVAHPRQVTREPVRRGWRSGDGIVLSSSHSPAAATRRVVGPSAVVTVCPEDLLFCDRGYALLAAAPRSESPAFRDRGSPGRNRQRRACRQIRVLRSAENTGHSGRIALDSVANAPGVFNSVGWVAGAGQPGQNNRAELFVVVRGVLDRWRLPDRAERAPTWRRTSDPRLWATYWAARIGGAVGCAGTGSRLGGPGTAV
jgi:hypothetical protein